MEAKVLLFLLILRFTSCPCKDTITINEDLKDGDLLISKGNKYALGFFTRTSSSSSSSSTSRYLGIWFHTVPRQVVVWVANRDNPIKDFSGVLSISQQGNLVLYSDNNPVWSTNASAKGQEFQLLDSGNLVLVQGEEILWQSFHHPTDTVLPGMMIYLNKKTGENRFLTSWRSANDPGTGDYLYKINPSGSPQIFLYNRLKPYLRTSPWPWRIYQDGYNFSFNYNEDLVYGKFSCNNPSVLTRVTLEYSGLLKWLTWHDNDGQWKEFLTLPKERCDFYGRCGPYGKCDINSVTNFECSCLPGYEPKLLRDWNVRDGKGGCVRKRKESSSTCGHGEGFIKVENVKIPDASVAVWMDKSMGQINCEKECKRNCSCSAYSVIAIDGRGSGCLTWHGELVDTMTPFPDSHDLYVRVDAIEFAASATRSGSFLQAKGILPVITISVVLVWLVIIIFIYIWLRKKKNTRTKKNKQDKILAAAKELEGGSRTHQDFVLFDLRTILAATDNFSPSNKIGKGGFGTVYKGQLSDGQEVAIKRLSNTSKQGIQELQNEVMLIAKLQHRNLVKLLGCCIEKKEQILVYEYLPNKSLDTFLSDESKRALLNWETRFNVIMGIARGILYLHQDSLLTIIHRDLKSGNILLDAAMNPKISDFGLAKLFKSDQIQGKTTRIVGTYGYMSPEYATCGKFSTKSDIFSFGVILLEIVSGKKSGGFDEAARPVSLIEHVWKKWNEDRALEIVDPSLMESCNTFQVLRCIQVGLLCVQEDDMDRPAMIDVILMLRSETSLPHPRKPAFTFTSLANLKSPDIKDISCSINDVTITALLLRWGTQGKYFLASKGNKNFYDLL